jgi:hypothetical protein
MHLAEGDGIEVPGAMTRENKQFVELGDIMTQFVTDWKSLSDRTVNSSRS